MGEEEDEGAGRDERRLNEVGVRFEGVEGEGERRAEKREVVLLLSLFDAIVSIVFWCCWLVT